MKKLILAAALATLVAAPALAQGQYSATARHGYDRYAGIRAQALPSSGGDNVIVNGQYVGSDPDANVRLQLQRDFPDNH